ncbi:MAG: FAD-dependent oxidoreductase [Candidatus Cloacimonas sp.]|jgi:dihydrolipoamide dehydrogenase|nr:FAD-dependent oxidoreductase [Candidatus Cloacimonas sp.]
MTYDLIIIGSGPAGYVAAIRAGQTGLKTLIIDKKYVGGMCLNWGCIPTKSMLESAKLFARIKGGAAEFGIGGFNPNELTFDWQQALKRNNKIIAKLTRGVEYLWKKNGVEFLKAEAKILSANEVEANKSIFSTKHILIATGSKPAKQDIFPLAIEIEDFFNLESLPLKPLILGRGATMIEFAQLFILLGRTPTLVYTKLPLVPVLDAYLEAWVQKKLKKDKAVSIALEELKIVDGKAYHGDKLLDYDAVINCSRREAILPTSKLELKLDNGSIATDEYYRTSIPNIFAAGDVNGKSYLAHAASAQGNRVIDFIHGDNIVEPVNYPINIYSEPEIAQIGLTEQELKAKGTEYQSREFSLAANGKALAEGASEGFIRLLFEPKYQQVLGVQIVSANATDLIAEAGLLMELEGTVYDLAKTVHAHPTIAEIFMDVAQE